MSYSLGNRKSSLKPTLVSKETSGPKLKFTWSLSAARLLSPEVDSSVVLPPIHTHRSRRNIFDHSPALSNHSSFCYSSQSRQKTSSLLSMAKKSPSSLSPIPTRKPKRTYPLSLSYAQLHRTPPPSLPKRVVRTRFTLHPIVDDKRCSVSDVNTTVSLRSRPSISSVSNVSISSNKDDPELSPDNLIRLHTPQLRALNVSDKYINEAKKLYFDATCRSFIPRGSITQVF